MQSFRYRAFISYSHADEKWAAWLHKALESYTVPSRLIGQPSPLGPIPRKLAPVFRDREELPSANDLGQKLQSALESSASLILICSPAAAKSRWVNEEVLAFKRLGRAHRIVYIIVGGEPNHPEDECFPPAARFQLDPQGQLSQTPAEPIAADARTGKDGRNMAKIKLIAGILEVGFDDLQQRELHRRHRRLAFITAASVAGMLVAVGLMFAAIVARTEAENQRELARIQAEKANQTTAFMVDLFSVSDPGEARGRSITAREILIRGADNIDTQLSDQPQVQAGLMETIGKVFISLGLFEDAEPLLRKASDKRAARLSTTSEDRLEQANGHFLLANVLTEQASYEEAETLYRQALSQLDIVAPERYTDTLAALAELYFRTGRYKDARPLLEQVLERRQALYGDKHPKVADAMAELGLNYFDQGDSAHAEQVLQTVLTTQRAIYAGHPHPDIGETLNNLGLILAESGRYSEASSLYTEAIAVNRQLYGDTHPAVAIGLNNLALLSRRANDLDRAEALFNEAAAIHRRLHGNSHPQIALVMTNLALVYADQGKSELARETLANAIDMQRETLDEADPQIARSQAILGRWLFESGALEQALEQQQAAIEKMAAALDPQHPRLIEAYINIAETLLTLGRFQEADAQLKTANAAIAEGFSSDHWYHAWRQSVEGALKSHTGDPTATEQLQQSLNVLAHTKDIKPSYINQAKDRLADHYKRHGQLTLAQQTRASISP